MPPSPIFKLHTARKLFSGAFAAIFFTLASSSCCGAGLDGTGAAAKAFSADVKPLVANYCLKCHSTEKHKGDIDFEQFTSPGEALKHPKPWERALEQLANRDMPPPEKPQPTAKERERMLSGVNAILDAAAQARAGDPGPVVLRRLNNAEYTYTVRDLTGVPRWIRSRNSQPTRLPAKGS